MTDQPDNSEKSTRLPDSDSLKNFSYERPRPTTQKPDLSKLVNQDQSSSNNSDNSNSQNSNSEN